MLPVRGSFNSGSARVYLSIPFAVMASSPSPMTANLSLSLRKTAVSLSCNNCRSRPCPTPLHSAFARRLHAEYSTAVLTPILKSPALDDIMQLRSFPRVRKSATLLRFSRESGSRSRNEPARTPLQPRYELSLAARSSSLPLSFRLRFLEWARYLSWGCVLMS